MDLEKMIAEELVSVSTDGRLKEIVRKHVENALSDAVRDAMGYNSPFKNTLTKAIEAEAGVAAGRVDLSLAGISLVKLVEAEAARHISQDAHKRLRKDLAKIFQPAPKTITLQEIVDDFLTDNARTQGDDDACALVIEQSTSWDKWLTIGIHPVAKVSRGYSSSFPKDITPTPSQCEIRMNLCRKDKGETYELKFASHGGDRGKILSTKDFLPYALTGFARRLFQMWAQGTEVVMNEGLDASNYDTSYSHVREDRDDREDDD